MDHRRSALLISPPVYDTQYWAHWSMPYGLLRVASWLRSKDYTLKLIDCMEANKGRAVKKQKWKVRKLCSTVDYIPEHWAAFQPAEDEKTEYCWGISPEELRKRLIDIGAEPAPMSPEELRAFISSEIVKWREIINRGGVAAEQ